MYSLPSFTFYNREKLFRQFINEFALLEKPCNLIFTPSKNTNKLNVLDVKYHNFFPKINSCKKGAKRYEASALIASTNTYEAVLLSCACEQDLSNISYAVVVYNKKGKKLDFEPYFQCYVELKIDVNCVISINSKRCYSVDDGRDTIYGIRQVQKFAFSTNGKIDMLFDMEFETAHNPITKEVYIISGRRDR